MGTFLLAAEAAAESGFGINFNLLESNIINLAIIISVLVYFGRKSFGKTLASRQQDIEAAIKEAEQRKQTAAAALADEQQKLAQAQAEAARLRAEAEERARSVREAILAQAAQDVERMRASAAQDLTSQQDRITAEVRQQIAAMAVRQVEDRLKSDLNDDTKRHLVDRSIALIGGAS